MAYIKFKNDIEAYEGSIEQVADNLIKVNLKQRSTLNSSGFKTYKDKKMLIQIGDFSDYTTIYDSDFTLSNDNSVKEVISLDDETISNVDKLKALESQNEELLAQLEKTNYEVLYSLEINLTEDEELKQQRMDDFNLAYPTFQGTLQERIVIRNKIQENIIEIENINKILDI